MLITQELLEAIPIIVGIRLHARAVVCQRDQQMTVQRDATKVTLKRFPIDRGLPPGWIRKLAGIPQLPEALPPDVKEVPKGNSNATWDFNMDDPTLIVRVEPVEARTIRGNPNMRMEVGATLLSMLTGDVVYRRVHHRHGRCSLLPHYHGDKADDNQHADCNETDDRAAPRADDTPLPFFRPVGVDAAPFLP